MRLALAAWVLWSGIFFTVSEKDVKLAVCKTCDAEILRGGNQQRQFNTTNLIQHLRTHHTTEYGEYEEQAWAKQIPKTPVTQLTVSETFRRLEPYSRDSKRWSLFCFTWGVKQVNFIYFYFISSIALDRVCNVYTNKKLIVVHKDLDCICYLF